MSYISQRYYGNHAIPQIKTENYQEIDCTIDDYCNCNEKCMTDDEIEDRLCVLQGVIDCLFQDISEMQGVEYYG